MKRQKYFFQLSYLQSNSLIFKTGQVHSSFAWTNSRSLLATLHAHRSLTQSTLHSLLCPQELMVNSFDHPAFYFQAAKRWHKVKPGIQKKKQSTKCQPPTLPSQAACSSYYKTILFKTRSKWLNSTLTVRRKLNAAPLFVCCFCTVLSCCCSGVILFSKLHR